LFISLFPQKGNTLAKRGKNTGLGKRLTEFLSMSLQHTYQLNDDDNVLLLIVR